jgi:ABC-type nickel/cobalt efflux system permease component RcnA
LTTSSSLLAQLSRHRSLSGGQAAVTVAVVGSMLVVAGAAWVVWRRRTRYLMKEYEEQLKNQVESYFAP